MFSKRKTIIAMNKARIRSRRTFDKINNLQDMQFDKQNNYESSTDSEDGESDHSEDSKSSPLNKSKQEPANAANAFATLLMQGKKERTPD